MSSDSARAAIELAGVCKTYHSPAGPIVALDNVNLRSSRPEVIVIMGVSGSGKTTLINVLAALTKPSSGSVTSFGVDLTAASPEARADYRRTISTVIFQEYNLLSMLRVGENVSLPLELQGMSRKLALKAAKGALSQMGIANLNERFPGELSGGQRQRVAIARALVDKRRLVLADEPTGSLDAKSTQLVLAGLAELRAKGATVIVATHDETFITIADRVLEMIDGQVAARVTV